MNYLPEERIQNAYEWTLRQQTQAEFEARFEAAVAANPDIDPDVLAEMADGEDADFDFQGACDYVRGFEQAAERYSNVDPDQLAAYGAEAGDGWYVDWDEAARALRAEAPTPAAPNSPIGDAIDEFMTSQQAGEVV